MRVYFAHPVSDYGTPRETAAAAVMEAVGWSVENPNQPHHQRGYDAGGMGYFEQIARACDGLAFMRFPNGAIGAGVGKEVGAALDASKPVYELFDGEVHLVTGMPTPVLSVAATRALLTELQRRREAEAGVPVAWLTDYGLASLRDNKHATAYAFSVGDAKHPVYASSPASGVRVNDVPWRYDFENVPRDGDFLIEFDHKEVTVACYSDKFPDGIKPCRALRPFRLGEKVVAWREMPSPDTQADNRCDYCREHGFRHPNLCEDCREKGVRF